MGYPMTWKRLLARNNLHGDYNNPPDHLSAIRGDIHRFESNMRDQLHVPMFARKAGITEEQVRVVLDTLFSDPAWQYGLDWPTALAEYRKLFPATDISVTSELTTQKRNA